MFNVHKVAHLHGPSKATPAARKMLVCGNYGKSTALLIGRPLCKVTVFSGAGTKSYITSLRDLGGRE